MRLLLTKSIKLREPPNPIPPYAILSHTWEGDEHEVTFQDIQNLEKAKGKKGYNKIKKCCDQAKHDGFDYVWVDTCCINKDSSSELSEAINSMYSWYRNSGVCYVYLPDLPEQDSPLFGSRWFTRGWTLQELVAPTSLIFYDKEWREIGTKASLKNDLSYITGVSPDILGGNIPLGTITVAKKMSWASNRVTTKGEDLAYSLMGIFNVNMPILYGEGEEKAFARLQEEIWKVVEDPTIFAWVGKEGAKRGLLAHYPVEFASTSDVERDLDGFYKSFNFPDTHSHSYMTNRGLLINLPLQTQKATMLEALLGLFINPSPQRKQTPVLAALPCKINDKFLAIWLLAKGGKDQYVRVRPDRFEYLDSNSYDSYVLRSVYINEDSQPENQQRGGEFEVRVESEYRGSVSAWTPKAKEPEEQTFHISVQDELIPECFVYAVREEDADHEEEFAVVLGIHQSTAWTQVTTDIKKYQLPQSIAQSVAKDSNHTDRVYKALGNNIGVHVSVTKLGSKHLIKVSVRPRAGSEDDNPRTLLTLAPKCILFCKISGKTDAFHISPHPTALWRQKSGENHSMHLFVMKDSKIPTYLEFKNNETTFQVHLGVDMRGAWTEIDKGDKRYGRCVNGLMKVELEPAKMDGLYLVTIKFLT